MNGAASFREATPEQTQAWLRAAECVLIDVRELDEHARERIPHAQSRPLATVDANTLGSTIAANPSITRVVFHCKGGRRSADAASRAAATAPAGVEIYSMSGGIDAWKRANLPTALNAAAPRMSVMQQTQLVIGLGTLTGSALAYFVHPAFAAIPAFFGAGLAFAGASGTCGLALLLAKMPWNRAFAGCSSGSCATPN